MFWSGLAKFLLGFTLAIALLIGGGVAAAMYFMNKVSTRPPKPIFTNEKPALKAQHRPNNATASTTLPTAQPSATPSPTYTSSPKPLESGAYKARANWPQGLSLRSEPNLAAEYVGSVGYHQPLIVLEQSADKNWQRVRLEGSEREGWIKAGNIERVERQ